MAKEPLKADERQKVLESRLKSLGMKPSALVRGEKLKSQFSTYISTGQMEIDLALGDLPGFAAGSVVELIGENSSGKTYLALKHVGEVHKQGKRVAWLNVENSFYAPRAEALGVDVYNPDLLEVYNNAGSGEKWGELAKALVKSGDYACVVIDSVTAMIPTADYDKSLEDEAKIGAHARMCGRLTQKLTELCGESLTTVILINQFRYGAGAIKGTFAKKSTGGESIGFYAHTRLVTSKINGAAGEVYDSLKNIIGGRTRVFVLKNRFGAPLKTVDFPIYFSAVESDPVIEFLMRAKSKQFELIKEARKKYSYITEDGEVIESKNEKEFIRLLQNTPSPSKRAKGDDSTTAFEFICRKTKFSSTMVQKLQDKLSEPDDLDFEEIDDDGISLSDLSAEEVAELMPNE